ncbi:hypothetical protein CONCODRAFT_6333 [Conidiobolus coronatus NRRL 28638]|uniref:Uncharacterized protein n=1 Tax=Conidiobolus coronatus (strain ATCC 28846 / CBS 209.66 / NRRL 28638) TaxID=796925 RepID=A0A137P7N9_CONC2|nr:hypothetical protein CONCODRAFT_6333 [Conidiobolus coronatus NRRL 28638]|eukprot:KXN71026.1 hypothetical protein CONCODRAFT_6333 [Conidiobolus coronatus NRRL 28638]
MLELDESTIFSLRCITFGICGGLVLIGMLFYLLNLTGDYKSVQSIAFVVSTFGLLACAITQSLPQFFDEKYHIYFTIAIMLSGPAACGYFVILFYNAYFICSKTDIIIILLVIIPMIVSGFSNHIIFITRYFGVQDKVDMTIFHYITIILDILKIL